MFSDKEHLTEKQKGILEAATELFAEKGYAATSTNEIAKKAGVAEGTIFRHYKSKKDLLLTVVSPVMIKLLGPSVKRDINIVLDAEFDHFEDFLRAIIQNRITFIRNNIPLLRIVIQEMPFHEELKQQAVEHIGKDIFQKLRDIVDYYQEKGQLADLHPDTIIRVVSSAIFSYILSRYVLFPEATWEDEEVEVERIIKVVSNGIKSKQELKKGLIYAPFYFLQLLKSQWRQFKLFDINRREAYNRPKEMISNYIERSGVNDND